MLTEYKNPDITTMLQSVIDKGMNVKTIEKILQLRNQVFHEYAKQEFIKALTNFQAEIPEITKDQTVYNKDGSIRYKYSSLDRIVSTIKPYLTKYNLSYRFETEFENNSIIISCIIQHISGHSEKTKFKIPIDNSNHMSEIQKYGSTLTYARRYSLCLALGLVTDEDNDAAPPPDEPATENQLKLIFSLLKDKSREERMDIVNQIINREITTSKELTKTEASKVIDYIKNHKENNYDF